VSACPQCGNDVLEIDVRCSSCGAVNGATGAHRMIGQVMLGQYELVDVLGQGGMSVVFKGRHKMTDQEVALKILPPELAAHSQVKSRFLEEAKALAALDHPNIVHLYNFGSENGFFVLAMQFVQGATWERMILEAKRLDWQISCRLAVDVLKALEYAHDHGIVHRDMKPSNVLVRAHDHSATVMDFGIAKMAQSTRLTATGQTMGTVRYMSPEQVRGQEVDLRTDIYSLGATLYESLVGDTPFDGSTHFEIMTKHLSDQPKRPSALGVEVPRAVEDALIKSLAKKVDDRFASAREMRKLLESVLRAEDVGLVDTQKLDRDILANLKTTKKDLPPPETPAGKRVVTASPGLADELEPGLTGSVPARKSSSKKRLVAVLLGLVVLGGAGATAAYLATRETTSSYAPTLAIPGVTITSGKRFEGMPVLFETDGTISPEELHDAYRATIAALEVANNVGAQTRVVNVVAAVPRHALCAPGIARTSRDQCLTSDVATTAIGKRGAHVLLLSNDKRQLAANIRRGLASAVCDFQPNYTDSLAKLSAICEMTKQFATGN
jgi:serine/threonine protein kinase